MSSKWCTIESDPGVFTELVNKIGVKGVQFEELYQLDDEALNKIKPIYGLVFLFKYVDDGKRPTLTDYDPSLFFARQVISNACATQAILSILLNQDDKLEIGSELSTLKEFTLAMNDRVRGETIGNSELIRKVHNSFARQDPFTVEDDGVSGVGGEDVFHFVSYVPHKGQLYELDGLQPGPISFGECTEENWVSKARDEIQKRIGKYQSKEIRFNVMAVMKDKEMQAQEEFDKLTALMTTETDATKKAQLESQVQDNQAVVAAEKDRKQQWKIENERRRHNYVPLIFELLQQFAKKDMLSEMFDDAQKAKKKKLDDKKAAAAK